MKALAITCALAGVASASGDVRVTVIDAETKDPLPGIIVNSLNDRLTGDMCWATDENGVCTLHLSDGRATISARGGDAVVSREVTVAGAPIALTIEIKIAGETIEVKSIVPTQGGELIVDPEFARRIPGGGDVGKVVQSLPSVARPQTGSTDIVIWGAAPNETRTFVEGVPVPALYHEGGYRSAIGSDLISTLHLVPAAFGVDRGGAIGGVIDIGLDTHIPQYRIQADVLDGTVETKQKLGDATIAAAVRQSWLDHAIGLIEDPHTLAPNAPLPSWTDAQIVATYPIADDLKLKAWALGSIDTLDRTLTSTDPATETTNHIDNKTVRASVSLQHDVVGGFDRAMLWFGRDHQVNDLAVGTITAASTTQTWLGGARALQQRQLGNHAALAVGLDLDAERAALYRRGSLTIPAREGDLYIFGQPPGDDVNADTWHATTIDAAGHAAVDLAFGRVTATVGARVDAWVLTASRLTPRVAGLVNVGSQREEFTPDPRGSVKVRITDAINLDASGGLYHQARSASDTSAVFGTPDLGLEEAWHAVAGAQYLAQPFAFEISGYARWLDDLVARDLAVTPMLAQALTQDGIGTVHGVQLTARLLDWHGVSGWLSYNWSRSRRQDAADQPERFFDHDQTNGVIAVASWTHDAWTFGGRIRYATGEPRTDVIGAFFDSRSGRYQPIYGPHNGVRLPDFFAADARAEYRFPHGAVYLEVQNLTNRENAEEIIYSADFSQRGYLTSLPLLAIAGVRLEP
ncbi:MAG: TonB-dependent receptor [Kofleriaceae bacterium]